MQFPYMLGNTYKSDVHVFKKRDIIKFVALESYTKDGTFTFTLNPSYRNS